MKYILLFTFSLLSLSCSACAGQSSYHIFGELDYWLEGSAHDSFKTAADNNVAGFRRVGYQASASVDGTGGLSTRAGAFFPTRLKGLELGGSLGFVNGPKGKVVTNIYSSNVGSGRMESNYETSFVRALFEVRQFLPLSARYGIRLRGGIGMARGGIRQKSKSSGVIFGVTPEQAAFWDGMTWELSPAFVWIAGPVNLDLGISYAWLPTLQRKDYMPEFSWHPIGIKFSISY